MKALIFNSGIGKRMGDLTKNAPKSMAKLKNGETIFERQIRILSECGIKEFVITTGPFADQLIKITQQRIYQNLTFHFVHNDLYAETNYIYSCYLARAFLKDDDFLTLHGDLVFDKALVLAMLKNKQPSLCLINKNLPLPEKDFKGRIQNGKLVEVSISIFDDDCYAFQPLYKISRSDLKIWLSAIECFVEKDKCLQVYAENAFNTVSHQMNIVPMSYEKYYINEIDNPDDYAHVSADIVSFDAKEQPIFHSFKCIKQLISVHSMTKPLVIIDPFLMGSKYQKSLAKYNAVFFSDFKPNPTYDNILNAIQCYKSNDCQGIITLGGGSAIDIGKALRLFLPLDQNNYLKKAFVYQNIPHIAIPTTAGTGSESTSFLVFYYNNIKQSIASLMALPNAAILDSDFLVTLPLAQKKSTVFDAVCQSIESMWSKNATPLSQKYASKALDLLLPNLDDYLLADNCSSLKKIFLGANYAGKAINISKTTAAHAMSYKITSLYHIAHGHAVALCLPGVWKILLDRMQNASKEQNMKTCLKDLNKISRAFKCSSLEATYEHFCLLLEKYQMNLTISVTSDEMENIISSVNLERLNNFPISLSYDDIKKAYSRFLKE